VTPQPETWAQRYKALAYLQTRAREGSYCRLESELKGRSLGSLRTIPHVRHG